MEWKQSQNIVSPSYIMPTNPTSNGSNLSFSPRSLSQNVENRHSPCLINRTPPAVDLIPQTGAKFPMDPPKYSDGTEIVWPSISDSVRQSEQGNKYFCTQLRISSLPKGYVCMETKRIVRSSPDLCFRWLRSIYGHPSGKAFRSISDFETHLKHLYILSDDPRVALNCQCCQCQLCKSMRSNSPPNFKDNQPETKQDDTTRKCLQYVCNHGPILPKLVHHVNDCDKFSIVGKEHSVLKFPLKSNETSIPLLASTGPQQVR
jgi:hypothetical protein